MSRYAVSGLDIANESRLEGEMVHNDFYLLQMQIFHFEHIYRQFIYCFEHFSNLKDAFSSIQVITNRSSPNLWCQKMTVFLFQIF